MGMVCLFSDCFTRLKVPLHLSGSCCSISEVERLQSPHVAVYSPILVSEPLVHVFSKDTGSTVAAVGHFVRVCSGAACTSLRIPPW